MVDEMFKRFLFEGMVISDKDVDANKDSKYWNDEEYRKHIESKELKYALIKITQPLYDDNIKSRLK